MTVEIYPSKAAGTAAAPPSKSMSHRALLCAALCSGGVSVIRNPAFSDDVSATVDCLRALGVRIERLGDHFEVVGIAPDRFPEGAVLPCRSSATTLRLLIPLVMLSDKAFTFTGTRQLFSRPLGVYEQLCRERGLVFDLSGERLTVRGALTAGTFRVAGNVSSQFLSGLSLALPLLPENSTIRIIPPLGSKPYLAMTLAMMRRFGVESSWQGDLLVISGGQRYHAAEVGVEGDWSNGAVLLALNALDAQISVHGLAVDSLQGDRVAPVLFDELNRGTPTLNLSDCPDLGPVCMALAAALHGAVFTGVERLRYKESDRVAAMTEELAKCGVNAEIEQDRVTIPGGTLHAPRLPFSAHDDHRIAMALAVLATRTGGVIHGADAVKKSWPDFFEVLQTLGVSCETQA